MTKYLCFLDFEATCESPEQININEIIEFPLILTKYENNTLTEISRFHQYVKPTIITSNK